jgi:hypothetical protein
MLTHTWAKNDQFRTQAEYILEKDTGISGADQIRV